RLCCGLSLPFHLSATNECLKANATSCGECIQAGKNCGWCMKIDFVQYGVPNSVRCDDRESLVYRGCPKRYIESPKGSQRIFVNKIPFRRLSGEKMKLEDIIQIRPQKLSLKLRSGEPQIFPLNFKRAEDYPIDLYYLLDLSASMKDNLENVKRLGTDLVNEMRNIVSDFRIGKNFCLVSDFHSLSSCSLTPFKMVLLWFTLWFLCTNPFSFRNVLPLTSDIGRFKAVVNEQTVSESRDPAEGAFDAIMQIAVCENEIAWRNATRLLVFSTDSGFNFAEGGDIGSVLPIDAGCQLNPQGFYTKSGYDDHPSIPHLVQKLTTNNIQLIFAVTKQSQAVYKALRDLIPKSEVGVLSSNSSNVIKSVLDAYHALSSEVILENSKLPEGVTIDYTAHCKNNTVYKGEDGRKCSSIQIGDEVSFNIRITANTCLGKGKKATVEIKPIGFSERVKVTLRVICECGCQELAVVNSPECYGNGALECGACRCREGHVGQHCECDISDLDSEELNASCRRDRTAPICSNIGDCICGECVCPKRESPNEIISGRYCECDNFSCERSNGLICGGNGVCTCGWCQCRDNFTGSACECSLDQSTCISRNGQICNGRGICQCGRCKCMDHIYVGPTCDVCPTCLGLCDVYKDCVQCKAFGKGPKKNTCDQCEFEVTLVEQLPESESTVPCKARDEEDCWFMYTYSLFDQNVPVVHVAKIQGENNFLRSCKTGISHREGGENQTYRSHYCNRTLSVT
uniref:Integrin beta n=1 Tax=Callorhinchus milii TaxID=7868 RepID=A0A4W3I2J7_CALMI